MHITLWDAYNKTKVSDTIYPIRQTKVGPNQRIKRPKRIPPNDPYKTALKKEMDRRINTSFAKKTKHIIRRDTKNLIEPIFGGNNVPNHFS
jgi:hypothetical protein